MSALIKPREHVITDMDGVEHNYIISRMPFTVGRKMAMTYSISNVPRLGEYKASDEAMLEMLNYVAVRLDGREEPLRLSTRALAENHIPDTITGLKLEWAMLGYNFGFFEKGSLSGFLLRRLQEHLPLIIETLTPLLPPSLVQDFVAGLTSRKESTQKTP
jgi:hypothetical protein